MAAKYPDVPVVCSLCGTRVYATREQVGLKIVCPDCDRPNLVSLPVEKKKPPGPRFTGDEYKLRDDGDQPVQTPALIKLTCTVCHTLMHAQVEHVGKRVKCPDCGAANVVPRPPETKKRAFVAPDASHVQLDKPREVTRKQKEVAERLMSQATQEIIEREQYDPIPPNRPFFSGVFTFPFYSNVIAIWFGAALASLGIWAMVDYVNSLMANPSYASILAIFVSAIIAISTCALAGFVSPLYLTIIEITAGGHDKIPEWPTSDMLAKGRSILFLINSLAVSSMPGMAIVVCLQPAGVPAWAGLPMTLLFLPFVLMSMLESDSPFAPWSTRIGRSWSTSQAQWRIFYLQTISLAGVIVVVTVSLWSVGPIVARVFVTFAVSIYLIVYFRLLGRLGWVVGEERFDPEPLASG